MSGGKKISFRLSDAEYQKLTKKTELTNCRTLSAYIRKMALEGFVIVLQVPELKEYVSYMKRMSNGINQICKRANATGNVYEEDIAEIQNTQNELWNIFNKIIKSISELV